VIQARFQDSTLAKPVLEMLEGVAFVNEGLRTEGVRIDERDDGSVLITVNDDGDMRLADLFRRAGGDVREVPDRPRN
jgi:hypothetical protein